jgi:hypothetical protein
MNQLQADAIAAAAAMTDTQRLEVLKAIASQFTKPSYAKHAAISIISKQWNSHYRGTQE